MTSSRSFLPPSGEQHEIRLGPHRAVATEVGATLRSYAFAGVDIVDGFAVEERSSGGRGQVLAPWPNRLDSGSYTFEGAKGRAALDEPDMRNAIHGLVRWLPWRTMSWRESAVVFGCVLHPQPAYPWRLELSAEYLLLPDGLAVTARALNVSDTPAPFGIGFHPYITVGSPRVDTAWLMIPALRRLVTDDRGLPTGEEAVAGTDFDFTTPRPIGTARLDTAFTDLVRGNDGRTQVELEDPSGRRGVTVWADPGFGYLMVYTADTLEPASRRRQALAVEPMTCPPNALRSGTDVIRLDPGGSWKGSWGISPR